MKHLYITIALLIILQGCGGTSNMTGGTETGDPNLPDIDQVNRPSEPSIEEETALAFWARTVCDKLTAGCTGNSADYDACLASAFTNRRLPEALGLGDEFQTLKEAESAEKSGDITPDLEAAKICETQINDLSCDSQEVSEAFEKRANSPFERLDKVISDDSSACREIFSLP